MSAEKLKARLPPPLPARRASLIYLGNEETQLSPSAPPAIASSCDQMKQSESGSRESIEARHLPPSPTSLEETNKIALSEQQLSSTDMHTASPLQRAPLPVDSFESSKECTAYLVNRLAY
jgi:hypothetical protein